MTKKPDPLLEKERHVRELYAAMSGLSLGVIGVDYDYYEPTGDPRLTVGYVAYIDCAEVEAPNGYTEVDVVMGEARKTRIAALNNLLRMLEKEGNSRYAALKSYFSNRMAERVRKAGPKKPKAEAKGPKTPTLKDVMEGAERAHRRVAKWPQWKRDLSPSTRRLYLAGAGRRGSTMKSQDIRPFLKLAQCLPYIKEEPRQEGTFFLVADRPGAAPLVRCLPVGEGTPGEGGIVFVPFGGVPIRTDLARLEAFVAGLKQVGVGAVLQAAAFLEEAAA